jgi:hypothetical protein
VVTGVPVGRPAPPPAQSFDVFTPIRRPDQDGAGYPQEAGYQQSYPDFGNPAPAPERGYPSPYDDNSRGGGFGNDPGDSPVHVFGDGPGVSAGNNGAADGGYQSGESGSAVDSNGLPRRVRQASIVPELRASAAANAAGATGAPSAASLADMRNTLSAMQRGWQQGRSQTQRDTDGNRTDGD